MKHCPYDLSNTSILKGLEHIPQSTALNPLEMMVPRFGIFYLTIVNQLYLC